MILEFSQNLVFKMSTNNQTPDGFKYKFCLIAAENGDLEELKRLHLSGHSWDKWTPAWTVQNGHLDCLKYAHENGCVWDIDTTINSAYFGQVKCLKYAIEKGCPYDDSLPLYAARNGHLECLKCLHENGFKLIECTSTIAADNGHLECFKYCFEVWDDQQKFWNHEYDLSKIMDKIDLDDPVWRRLFTIDLSKYPQLQSKVNAKKQEIEEMKEASKDALQNTLPMDVIKYCLQPYF